LAFNDIRPQAPVHVLVIPKGAYVTFDHFAAEASAEEIAGFSPGGRADHRGDRDRAGRWGAGYRTLSNAGDHAVQEVPHYHMHILAGRPWDGCCSRPDCAAQGCVPFASPCGSGMGALPPSPPEVFWER
jgi:histidine triad (HIT) family protein